MKLEAAIQKAFDRCNLIGDNVDIYAVLYRYKAIRELDPDRIDQIYEEIADNLGLGVYNERS